MSLRNLPIVIAMLLLASFGSLTPAIAQEAHRNITSNPKLLDQLLQQLTKDVASLGDHYSQVHTWCTIAAIRLARGDRPGAIEALAAADVETRPVLNPVDRAGLYAEIAVCFARVGDDSEFQNHMRLAKLTAEEIHKSEDFSDINNSVIEAEVLSGIPERALKRCADIKDLSSRCESYRVVAGAALSAETLDLYYRAVKFASETAAQFADGELGFDCSIQRSLLADMRVTVGDYHGAAETAATIKFPYTRAEAFLDLARARLRTAPAEARKWLEHAASGAAATSDVHEEKIFTYVEIANLRSELGDKFGAVEALKAAEKAAKGMTADDSGRDISYQRARIAEGYFIAGDAVHATALLRQALQEPKQKQEPEAVADRWLSIAAAQAASGDVSGCRQSVENARAAVKTIEAANFLGLSGISMTERIAGNLVRAGKLADARDFAGGLKYAASRIDTFETILKFQLDRNDAESAWQTAKESPADISMDICHHIAALESRAGRASAAAKIALSLDTPGQRVGACTAVIEAIAPAAVGAATFPDPASASDHAAGKGPAPKT